MFLDVSRFSFEGSAQGEIRPVGGTRVPSEARKSLAVVAGVFFYLVSVYACFMSYASSIQQCMPVLDHILIIRACHGPTLMGRPGAWLGRADNFAEDGPRPAPAHHIFKISRPGPAHRFSKVSARPGPAHHMTTKPMKHGLYMGRPMCCPVLKGACAYADVIL